MANPSPLFSQPDYYLNETFQALMRQWNTYINSEETDDEILAEWEEIIIKDFRRYANEWLKENKNKSAWRKDLR